LLTLAHRSIASSDVGIVVIPEFVDAGHSADWRVRDSSYAYADPTDFLALGVVSAGTAQWRPQWNFIVPDDGTPTFDMYGGGISKFKRFGSIDLQPFIDAGDANVQLFLPTSEPFLPITFVSTHFGMMTVMPEPAGRLLATLCCCCGFGFRRRFSRTR
jgi:hypothetical protein